LRNKQNTIIINNMSAIGIDLGSSKAVMGVVSKGVVEIVLSDTSGRSVPVQCAFTDAERLAGEGVKPQTRRNFKNTLLYATRFLGLNTACQEQLKIEQKFTLQKVTQNAETNKISWSVTQGGEKHDMSVE